MPKTMPRTATKRTPTKRLAKHPFKLGMMVPGVKKEAPGISWADVYYARKPVTIFVFPENVKDSIACDGACDSLRCPITLAVRDPRNKTALAKIIPPGVLDREDFGMFVETTGSRIYISTKLDERALPVRCIAAGHREGNFVKVADGPNGLKKLEALLAKQDRPYEINLLPVREAKSRAGVKRPPRTSPIPPTVEDGEPTGNGSRRRAARIRLTGVSRPTPTTI